jgi:hypothetical protein
MKKPASSLGDEYGFGGNGMTVQKKAKHMAAQRLEKALKDARGAGGVSFRSPNLFLPLLRFNPSGFLQRLRNKPHLFLELILE